MPYVMYAASAGVAVFVFFAFMLKHKEQRHYFMISASASLSYCLFIFGSSLTGDIRHFPFLINSDIVATLIASSSVYLSFLDLMQEGKYPVKNWYLYFISPAAMAVVLIILNFFIDPLTLYSADLTSIFSSPVQAFLNFFGDVSFTIYFFLALAKAFSINRKGEIQYHREFLIMVGFLIVLFITSLVSLSSYIFRTESILVVGTLMYACIVVVFFLFSARFPKYILGLSDHRRGNSAGFRFRAGTFCKTTCNINER